MNNLNQYINSQQENISQALAAISALQKQLTDLQQEVRVQEQVLKAQQTANREVEQWLKQGKKLLADLCGVFPPEALQDIAKEVESMAAEVSEKYEEHARSGRFLKPEPEEPATLQIKSQPVDAVSLPMLFSVEIGDELPPPDDDSVILSERQIELILSPLDEQLISVLKGQWGISGKLKNISGIAAKLNEYKFTYKGLNEALSDAKRELRRNTLIANGKGSNEQ